MTLGTLVNTHGVRGELRLRPHNPDTAAVSPGAPLFLRRDGKTREVCVLGVRPHKNYLLLTIEGVDSMTAAEALVGGELLIAADLLPALEEGEVYHYQLVGCRVVTTAGEEIGEVTEIFTTAANDVCVVRRSQGQEVMIPLIAEVVREIDTAAGRLVIEPLPGLLDPP